MKKENSLALNVAVVGLDLSPMDTILFTYMEQINRVNKFHTIYFIHISRELELPDDLLKNYPDLMAPLDESISHDIKTKLNNYKWGKDTDIITDVEEGNLIKTMLHYATIKSADLLVLGRKSALKGSGVSASRITRKANCSVLMVPEILPERRNRILLTIDFGATSEQSYKVAENLMENKNTDLSLIHLYHVPHGYSKTGKSYEEFDTIMLQNAENEFDRFIANLKMKTIPDVNFVNGDNEEPEEVIMDYAQKIQADLIVIGSKGKSTSAFILLGSLAEKLLSVNNHIPLLIVKKKGENMSFFDALKNL